MIMDAKNLQVSGKCKVFQLVSTISNILTLETTSFISMCAGESNPTPLAIMEKTRHRPHLQAHEHSFTVCSEAA